MYSFINILDDVPRNEVVHLLVRKELYAFGINEQKLQIDRAAVERQGYDNGIETDGFPRTGLPRDEQVRSLRNVKINRVALCIHSKCCGQAHSVVCRMENVAEWNFAGVRVRDFDGDGFLFWRKSNF